MFGLDLKVDFGILERYVSDFFNDPDLIFAAIDLPLNDLRLVFALCATNVHGPSAVAPD
jgi:hypothetical protein